MKKIKIRLAFSTFYILLSTCIFTHAYAQTPNQDEMSDEGLQTRLTDDEAKDVQAWVISAQSILRDAQQRIPTFLNPNDRVAFLTEVIERVVPQQDTKSHQDTLLRYALNRARKIKLQMDAAIKEIDPTKIPQESRVLEKSIDIALRYSTFDLSRLEHSLNPLPLGEFGVEEADALLLINESDINPKAQLKIALEAIAWLHVDLSNDEREQEFQDPISRIFDLLKDENVANMEKNPVQGLKVIRTTYFKVLTDIEHTDTPVGNRIREIETRNKRIKIDRRIPKL